MGDFENINNEIEAKIMEMQKKLKNKVVDIRIDVVYFIVTAIVFIIFISIILMDTFQNIKIYYNRRRLVEKDIRSLQSDDNDYPEEVFKNQNDIYRIEEQIMSKASKQRDVLKPMLDLKVSNKIPQADIMHGQIDLNVLDPRFDDNSYNNKNGDSFWKMLFMPPKYYELINNRSIPYFKINEDN
jgi:hypothetical protein